MKKKSRTRRLGLRKETLHRLSTPEMEQARGGLSDVTCKCDSVSAPGCICLNTNVGCDTKVGC
jgi:hypothetical protein